MKLATFSTPSDPGTLQPGLVFGERIHALPFSSLLEIIEEGPQVMAALSALQIRLASGSTGEAETGLPLAEVTLHPPIPRPSSLRDFYAFEQHVVTAHANRGRSVPAEWYQFPVFYFSNPNSLFGHQALIPCPAYTHALDYELEIACIIGKGGMDIPAQTAVQHIFGYTIFNDWSARDIQALEMRVSLGPAKGKDFASSLGPWIVTPDELDPHATGRSGVYDLAMTARVNGIERSRANFKDIHYSFGDLIERASASVQLYPGEVIGSGTAGTGCLLELTRAEGPWLQAGDKVELEIEGIGVLSNTITTHNGRQDDG